MGVWGLRGYGVGPVGVGLAYAYEKPRAHIKIYEDSQPHHVQRIRRQGNPVTPQPRNPVTLGGLTA